MPPRRYRRKPVLQLVEGASGSRQAHDILAAAELLDGIDEGQMVLADGVYDADRLCAMVTQHGSWAHIPRKRNRKSQICFSPWLYKQRNLIERFFNNLKYFRRIATRYDKLGSTFLAMAKLACVRLRLRYCESTAYSCSDDAFPNQYRA